MIILGEVTVYLFEHVEVTKAVAYTQTIEILGLFWEDGFEGLGFVGFLKGDC